MSTQDISPIRMATIGIGLFAVIGVVVIGSGDGQPAGSAVAANAAPQLAAAPRKAEAVAANDSSSFDAWVDGAADSEEAVEDDSDAAADTAPSGDAPSPVFGAPPPMERHYKSDTPGSKILRPDPSDERGSHDNAGDNNY